jgi:hypothetical protein
MEDVRQYDHVLLKDGREGCAVEVFDQDTLIVDVGTSPADWETIDVKGDDIASVTHQSK